jgi:glucose-1-phosphate cytidylyltransferase
LKVVILAGGMGSRISEESSLRPKPMIEIGDKPILWHIMKIYESFGLTDFIICLGYKGYMIVEYFANYVLHNSDITIDLNTNKRTFHDNGANPWTVTLAQTGLETQTGGRLKRAARYLDPGEPFCMTYGDGVADIEIDKLIEYHQKGNFEATMTTVVPPGRFGATVVRDGKVTQFVEKPTGGSGRINGGFFVMEPRVIDRITDDRTIWEHSPLESMASEGTLGAYPHDGFWQPMDMLRDKNTLDDLWESGRAPWKCWD